MCVIFKTLLSPSSRHALLFLALSAPAIAYQAPPAKPKAHDTPALQPPTAPPDARRDETLKQQRTQLNLAGTTDAAAGESRRNENVQVNLIDNNAQKELNRRLGTTATINSLFEAHDNYYGAEFGAAAEKFTIASFQSAHDAFHGTFAETHSNSLLGARSFFQAGGVQPAHENRYGLSLEVPLASRGRFGYLSVEGAQQKLHGSVNGDILIPTQTERSVLAADPAKRTIISKWLQAYPNVTPNRADIDPHLLNTNATQIVDTNTAGGAWQRPLGKRDRLISQYRWTTQNLDAFQLLPGQNPDTSTRSHNSRITWNRQINAAYLMSLTAGFDRVHSLLTPEPNAVGPQVIVGTSYTTLGPASEIPIDRVQNRYRSSFLFRGQKAKLQWSAGFDVFNLHYNGREVSSTRTNWFFRNDFGRDAITNFRLGTPSRFSTGTGELSRAFRFWGQAYFAGARWQATSTLTVSAGLRFEPIVAPHDASNTTPVNLDCDCNNFAPQFSLAQRLPGRFGVLRAAYVWSYAPLPSSTIAQLRWDPPAFHKMEVQAPDLLNPLKGILIGPDTRVILLDVPKDLKTPYSQQYSLSWELGLPAQWKLSVGYLGSRTWKLFYQWYGNRALALPGIPLSTDNINLRRPDVRYYDHRKVRNMGRAYFDAGRADLTSPVWHGGVFELSYWLSKAIDTGSNYTTLAAGEDPRNEISQSEFNASRDLRGPSVFDQRQALSIRWTTGLPRFRQRLFRTQYWLGGWSFSAVFLAKTGMPFTVFTGSDGPGHGNVDGDNGDRPDLLDPSILGRAINNPDTARTLLPISAFRPLTPGQSRGNLGWDTFRRGGIRNLNASLRRTWVIQGEKSITFRAESINLTNTPQFAEPITDLTSSSFGLITNTLNDGRNFQFTLQLHF